MDQQKEWRERNKEKLKEDKARWYQEHKEEHDARNKAWIAAHPEARKRHVKDWYKTHSFEHRLTCARAKAKRRNHAFAVTLPEVVKAAALQCGRCAICGNYETRMQGGQVQVLSIDHCHDTGVFRGLICNDCNLMLGCADDNSAVLLSAANYLGSSRDPFCEFDGHA